jgi:hypothetical protein
MTNKLVGAYSHSVDYDWEKYELDFNGETIVSAFCSADSSEDSTMLRNFSFVHNLPNLLKRFYELGQQTPDALLEIEKIDVEEGE